MMEYKGYHADVHYDETDRIFVGEVFGINDSLNFHGSSVEELENMFHQSIDNYLDLCRQTGKSPDKEFRGVFTIRLTPEQHRMAALAATRRHISLNQLAVNALMETALAIQ